MSNNYRSTLFNDGRGELFSKMFFKNPYDNPINVNLNSLEFDILSCKYNTERNDEMVDNDIHNQVIDLVVRAALYHKTLDKTIEVGTKLCTLRNVVESSCKFVAFNSDDGSNIIIEYKGNTYKLSLLSGILFHGINEQKDELIEYLKEHNKNDLGVLLIGIVNFLSLNKASTDNDNDKNLYSNYINKKLDELINKLLEHKNESLKNKSINCVIDEFITSAKEGTEETLHITDILNNIRKNITGFINAKYKYFTESNISVDAYVSNTDLFNEFFNEFCFIVYSSIKEIIVKHFSVNYINLEDNNAKKFYENVFLQWINLNSNEQELNSKLLQLRKVREDDKSDKACYDDGYDVVDQTAYGNNIPENDLYLYRINFRKDTLHNTLFGNILPHLPIGNVINNIWYTNSDKKVVSVKFNNNASLLQYIYECVYNANIKGHTYSIKCKLDDDNVMLLPISLDNTSQLEQFTVNVDNIVADDLNNMNRKVIEIDELDGAIHNPVNASNIWLRSNDEEQALFKKTSNGDIEYASGPGANMHNMNEHNNCFTTHVKVKDSIDCANYMYKCLLNNDADKFDECVDSYLATGDFFKATNDEINNMHPLIALRMLQRFGFKAIRIYDDAAKMQLKKIQSVEDWINRVLTVMFSSEKVQRVFDGSDKNTYLLQYLQQVVNYVNRNPAILNKDYKGTTNELVDRQITSEEEKEDEQEQHVEVINNYEEDNAVNTVTSFGELTPNATSVSELLIDSDGLPKNPYDMPPLTSEQYKPEEGDNVNTDVAKELAQPFTPSDSSVLTPSDKIIDKLNTDTYMEIDGGKSDQVLSTDMGLPSELNPSATSPIEQTDNNLIANTDEIQTSSSELVNMEGGETDINNASGAHNIYDMLANTVTSRPSYITEDEKYIYGPFGQVEIDNYEMIPEFLTTGKCVGDCSNTKNSDGSTNTGTELLRELVNSKLGELETNNKFIVNQDMRKINDKLDELDKIDNQILKTIRYYQEYRKLIHYFKNYANTTLSKDNVDKLLDRNRKLIDKKVYGEKILLNLLSTLDNIQNDVKTSSYQQLD